MKQIEEANQKQQSTISSKSLKKVCSKSKLTEIIEENLSEHKKVLEEEEVLEDMLSMNNNFSVS